MICTTRKNQQFQRFALVGIIGFIVDAAILTVLMSYEYGPMTSRSASFSIAVSVTWLLNKSWSFKSEAAPTSKGYLTYAAIQLVGAGINFTIFGLIMALWTTFKNWPIIPLAIAAFFSLIFNFFASRRFAFNSKKECLK